MHMSRERHTKKQNQRPNESPVADCIVEPKNGKRILFDEQSILD